MKNSIYLKIILGLCAILVIIPGGMALFSPEYFTGRNGENITGKISLLNDYRATGMLMLACGLVIFSGILNKKMAFTAIVVAIITHLGLALGRWMSIAQDGMPADNLFKASVVETVLGLLALFALFKFRDSKNESI